VINLNLVEIVLETDEELDAKDDDDPFELPAGMDSITGMA